MTTTDRLTQGSRIALESCALAALVWWGLATGDGVVGRIALGAGVPFAAAVLWGTFAGSRRPRGRRTPLRRVAELAALAGAVAALAAAWAPAAAVVLGAAVALSEAVAIVSGASGTSRRTGADPAVAPRRAARV